MTDNTRTIPEPLPEGTSPQERTRTHIKAAMEAVKDLAPEQPAGLFMSGMLTGLASGLEILDGGTAEQALATVNTRLAAAIGTAYLAGTLPANLAAEKTSEVADDSADAKHVDSCTGCARQVSGAQASLAADLHQALGHAMDGGVAHQGYPSWSDWWAMLIGQVSQRTRAEHSAAADRALADGFTGDLTASVLALTRGLRPEPADLFFPTAYGATVAQAHPATPHDPPYMIDLVGYADGGAPWEEARRLIVHRSLLTSLLRDVARLTGFEPANFVHQAQNVQASDPHEVDEANNRATDDPPAEEAVTRLIALYERWSHSGPPIGVSQIAYLKWWREHLAELHDAIAILLGGEPATPDEMAQVNAILQDNGVEGELGARGVHTLATAARARLEDLNRTEAERDGAYRERAHLVALLTAMTDGAVITSATDVDEPGWQIVYLTIGGRRASWHISPRDADLVAHVPYVDVDDPRAQWNGHTTEEKYEGIHQHTLDLFHQCGPACSEGHTYTGRCEAARTTAEG